MENPSPRDEHDRLALMYGEEEARRAPLDKKQAALIGRKRKEKRERSKQELFAKIDALEKEEKKSP